MDAIRSRFSKVQVLVAGDVMLDEYLLGAVNRISPEAPVPVVEIKDRQYVAGGAGNVAANVVSLSAQCRVLGLCGDDDAANTLRSVLTKGGVNMSGLVCAPGRATTRKTRVIAGQQQVVRFDVEDRAALDGQIEEELRRRLEDGIAQVDICVLSDYGKGVLSDHICRAAIDLAHRRGIPVLADPKGLRLEKYRGCTLMTPNQKEASRFAGMAIEREEDVITAGQRLLAGLSGSAVLITRGPDGMTLFREGQPPVTIPTVARTVYDVVGAGDTVMAALSVSLGAGLDFQSSMQVANIAAGIAVGKQGTVTVGLDEVLEHAAVAELTMGTVRDH